MILLIIKYVLSFCLSILKFFSLRISLLYPYLLCKRFIGTLNRFYNFISNWLKLVDKSVMFSVSCKLCVKLCYSLRQKVTLVCYVCSNLAQFQNFTPPLMFTIYIKEDFYFFEKKILSSRLQRWFFKNKEIINR